MSTVENTTNVTPVAPPVTIDPATSRATAATQPATATPAAAPAQAKPEDEKPSWLDARLERERNKVLKDLGVESFEDAKKALDELNAKREAEKTAAQKAAELDAALKATKADKDALAEAVALIAKDRMAALTDAQKNAVTALAGDDAAKQLKAIDTLAPTWKAEAPAAATATPATQTKTVDTAPAPSAPNGAAPTSPPDPKAVYEELRKSNPIIAARYAEANGLLIL